MNENRTDAIGSLKAVAGKRTLPRLRLSIGRMMQIIVGLAFIFALIAISARTAERASRMNGQSPRCVSNLHNIVLGILGYHDANRVFPTGTWPNPDLEPESRLSWYALILPHIDRAEEQGALEKDEPWNSRQNDVYAHKYNPLLLCPNRVAPAPAGLEPTYYVGIAGLGPDAPTLPKSDARAGVFGYDRKTTLADITDGAANTMLIAETARTSGSWLQGGHATIRGLDPAGTPYIGPGGQFGGLHPRAGAWVAMADGSVRWVDASVNHKVFEALSTIAGGEQLPRDWQKHVPLRS